MASEIYTARKKASCNNTPGKILRFSNVPLEKDDSSVLKAVDADNTDNTEEV